MLKHVSFLTESGAVSYLESYFSSVNESNEEAKRSHIIWNRTGSHDVLLDALRVIESASKDETRARQFVILIGGPSTGKGYLTYCKFGKEFGLVNGQTMKDWLDISELSDKEIHEGDKILREIQRGVAIIVFNRLYNAALAAGKSGFDSAIKEVYYMTKDGEKNMLSDHIKYSQFMACLAQGQDLGADLADLVLKVRELKKTGTKKELAAARKELVSAIGRVYEGSSVMSFDELFEFRRGVPEKKLKSVLYTTTSAEPKSLDAFEEFFEMTNAQFWKSMRGWRDESVMGIERFKEAARREFEKFIKDKPGKVTELENIIVVDSPGEDVDKQPYVGQCAEAERAGYVTNIINLNPMFAGSPLLFMRLNNFSRNINDNDRMVDDSDITGYLENVSGAIARIKDYAFPNGPVHRYFHLVKDVVNDQMAIQIFEALNGVMKRKDDFVSDPSVKSAADAIAKINDMKININLATKLKSKPDLYRWWAEKVRAAVMGIEPYVGYVIADDSIGVDLSSLDALDGSKKRLAEIGDIKSTDGDYREMLKSVERWEKEYQAWTDADTWKALEDNLVVERSSLKKYFR